MAVILGRVPHADLAIGDIHLSLRERRLNSLVKTTLRAYLAPTKLSGKGKLAWLFRMRKALQVAFVRLQRLVRRRPHEQ